MFPITLTQKKQVATQVHAPTPIQVYAPTPTQVYAPTPTQVYAPTPTQVYAPTPTQVYAPTPDSQLTVISHLSSVRHVFMFSPFGLGCRLCKKSVTIQIEKRSLQIHMKKHSMDSSIKTVEALFEKYQARLKDAKDTLVSVVCPF